MTEGTWNLYLLAVHPDHQGRGRGSALVHHVEQDLRSAGTRVLLIETSGVPELITRCATPAPSPEFAPRPARHATPGGNTRAVGQPHMAAKALHRHDGGMDATPDTTQDSTADTWFSPLTPLAFLQRSAEVFPDKDAIVYGDQHLTYRDFAAEATRLARALIASGVTAGDRVAYLLPNIPQMLVAHFGVPLAGGVLVAINTRLAPAEVRHILRHSGAKVLVVDSALHASVAEVAGDKNLDLDLDIVTIEDPASGAQLDPIPLS